MDVARPSAVHAAGGVTIAMGTAVRAAGRVVAAAKTAAVPTTTASRCGQRGHEEQRDHRKQDAAAAHGTLHRRSVARRGATGTVLYLKHPKWASGPEASLVTRRAHGPMTLSRTRSA